MIDVAGETLGSHLKGVASLLQSRQVQGDSESIRGAAYWTWYRHEIWAALQTGSRISLNETYWEPPLLESFDHLHVEDIANRAIFILGQCIDFSNGYGIGEEMEPDEMLQARHTRAAWLEMALDDWHAKLTPSMPCFLTDGEKRGFSQDGDLGGFSTLWFVFPQSCKSLSTSKTRHVLSQCEAHNLHSYRSSSVSCEPDHSCTAPTRATNCAKGAQQLPLSCSSP